MASLVLTFWIPCVPHLLLPGTFWHLLAELTCDLTLHRHFAGIYSLTQHRIGLGWFFFSFITIEFYQCNICKYKTSRMKVKSVFHKSYYNLQLQTLIRKCQVTTFWPVLITIRKLGVPLKCSVSSKIYIYYIYKCSIWR